jgi:hypothetical protein
MNLVRIPYRFIQAWNALVTQSAPEDQKLAHQILTPMQMNLFLHMQAGEQVHSIRILRELMNKGERHPDLMLAALLHDVGKIRHPLRIWEKAISVLGKFLSPEHAKRWGKISVEPTVRISWWQWPFIVSEQHADWGADLVFEAGASPLATSIIRRHQQYIAPGSDSLEDILVQKLQSIDDHF